MTRPNKEDYLTTNQYEYDEKIREYYDELEKYVDYLESKPIVVNVHDANEVHCYISLGDRIKL